VSVDANGPAASRALAQQFPESLLRGIVLAPRPAFYAFNRIKDEVVATLGASAGASWLMERAGIPGPWSASDLPLQSLMGYACSEGALVEEWSPARDVLAPDIVRFGAPSIEPQSLRTRAFFLCQLKDATVFSKSNFIRVGDVALADFQSDELVRAPLNLNVDAAVMSASQGRVTLLDRPSADAERVAEALTLVGLHSFNFGHWVSEFLPKLWACLGRPEFAGVPLLVDEQMPAQHFESLRMFATNPLRVVRPGEQLRVERLWTASAPVCYPIGRVPGGVPWPGLLAIDAGAFNELLRRTESRWLSRITPHAAARVYLARSDSQHRRMLNRTQVEDWLAKCGFEQHDFYKLSFQQQLEIVRGARTIVGPDGSSFFATYFAQEASGIGVLTGPSVMHYEVWTQVWAARHMRVRVLSGVEPTQLAAGTYFNDYVVDVSYLPALLEQLETAAA
jgi:hypothetical protein